MEAELKKDTYQEAFITISDDTVNSLDCTIEKHNYVMLEALCYYYDAYASFFMNGLEYLKDMKAAVNCSKEIVAEVSFTI